jgi:hypothetical protein
VNSKSIGGILFMALDLHDSHGFGISQGMKSESSHLTQMREVDLKLAT